MGPDAEQANILLLTFKTKIEEAISLVNQMPEDMRQDAWQFWQKVSTAIKAATIGIKKRKPFPGGKDIIPRPRKKKKKKEEIAERNDEEEEVVESFVLDSPADVNPTTIVSTIPPVTFGQDTLAQDLKLLYSSVYTKETTDAVAAMIASHDSPVVLSVKDSDSVAVTQGSDTSQNVSGGAINVFVQDFVDDQVITSLVTIETPTSPAKMSPRKPSPKKRQSKKTSVRRKSRKKESKTEDQEQEKNDQTNPEKDDSDKTSPKKSQRKRKPRKKKSALVAQDAVSKALAENLAIPQSENLNLNPTTGVDNQVGDTPLAENKSSNKKIRKPRRSSRQPKPKKLTVGQDDPDGMVEGEGEGGEERKIRKRRIYLPGEPKQDLGPVTCTVCGIKLAYISSLAAHMRKHTGDRPFVCDTCHKPFTTKANMLRHVKTHSGEKPFQCEICQKRFTEKKTLKVHMRSHTGERPFKCPDCGIGFSQSGTLKSHMHRHSGHKGNLCDLCGRAFRQKSQLRVHLKRHFNLKAYKCEKCDQTFYCRGDLTRHEMRHTGERPFACTQCPKTFTRLQYLKEHENQHNGVTPYSCETCSIRFSDHSSYYRHMQKHKKSKAENSEDSVHLVVDSEAMENEAVDSVPALLVTADHIHHLFGVNSANSGEVYRIALVDQTGDDESQIVQDPSQADFSAINLLASATTQLSMSQETESDLKQMTIPPLLN